MKKYGVHVIWIIVVIVGFIGGVYYGKTTVSATSAGKGSFTSSTRVGFSGRTGASGTFIAGQIAAIDSSSITVQLPTGSSEIVFYSSSTSVSKPTTVPVSVLTTGTMVTVAGTQNADGSFTAQTIQVRQGSGAGFGAQGGAPSPSSQ